MTSQSPPDAFYAAWEAIEKLYAQRSSHATVHLPPAPFPPPALAFLYPRGVSSSSSTRGDDVPKDVSIAPTEKGKSPSPSDEPNHRREDGFSACQLLAAVTEDTGKTLLHRAAALGLVDIIGRIVAIMRAHCCWQSREEEKGADSGDNKSAASSGVAGKRWLACGGDGPCCRCEVEGKEEEGVCIDVDPTAIVASSGAAVLRRCGGPLLLQMLLDRTDHKGRTALYEAVSLGRAAAVRALADAGANVAARTPQIVSSDGETLLFSAIINGNTDVARELLRPPRGCVYSQHRLHTTHEETTKESLPLCAYTQRTLACDTCAINMRKCCQPLENKNESTAIVASADAPLCVCADRRRRLLTAINTFGEGVLHTAAEIGSVATAHALKSEIHAASTVRFTTPQNGGSTVASNPTSNADTNHIIAPIVSLLLRCGADAGSRANFGQQPLHTAAGRTVLGNFAASKATAIARALLDDGGADAEGRDSEGGAPLHSAASRGNNAVARCLVRDANADMKALNDKGETPLHVALPLVPEGTINSTRLSAPSSDGAAAGPRVPFSQMRQTTRVEVMRLRTAAVLLAMGADGAATDPSGRKALNDYREAQIREHALPEDYVA